MSVPRFHRSFDNYSPVPPISLKSRPTQFLTPEKLRPHFSRSKSPEPFGGLLKTLSRSRQEGTFRPKYQIINSADQLRYRPRINRSLQSNSKAGLNYSLEGPPQRYWKGLYHGTSPDKVFKRQYDYHNRSPITWIRTLDNNLLSQMPKQSYSVHLMQYQNMDYGIRSRLNFKRIAKGMGYKKSNIFFN